MTANWPGSIDEAIIDRIRHRITNPTDALMYSPAELAEIGSLSLTTCRELLHAISRDLCSSRIKHDSKMETKLRTPISSLDLSLGGGFQVGWLVEVCGESGSGKTQFCLSVAANALKGNSQVYWIDTENSFRPERIVAILGNAEALSNLHVAKCTSLGELRSTVTQLGDLIQGSKEKMSTVIIDSVAAPARVSVDLAGRQKLLHELARKLKTIHGFCIVTNHVVANIQSRETCHQPFIPALGNTWSHDVSCRLWFKKRESGESETHRWIDIIKSPIGLEFEQIPFIIDSYGASDYPNCTKRE